MSINHIIDPQATPKYNIYCNNINVEGNVRADDSAVITNTLYAQHAFFTDLRVDGNLTMVQDEAGSSTLSSLPYLESAGASDGFNGIDLTTIVAYTFKKTKTATSLVREFTFSFLANSLASAVFKINFIPNGFTPLPGFNITNLDFKVIDPNAGATITPQVIGINPYTYELSSSLVIGTITAGTQQVYISITTSEDI